MSSEMVPYVVVAACIIKDGHVMLAKRTESVSNPSTIGYWELPGGRVNLGEDLRGALKREIFEELRAVVVVGDLLHAQVNTYDDGEDYLVLYYHCRLDSPPAILSDNIMWVKVAHGLDQFDVLPGTKEAIAEAERRGYLL